MYTNAQNQPILRILTKALDLNSFVTNQYLISQLKPQNKYYTLHTSVFIAFPEFITMQVTEEDINDSAKQLQNFYPMDNYLYLPYHVFPHMLVMKEFYDFANSTDHIFSYIISLHGSEPPAVHQMVNDIVVTFPSIEECIIFWRGTKYYPFQGKNGTKYIECQIFSQLYANYPIQILQKASDTQPIQTEQQRNQKHYDQYNDKYQSSNQNYQQKKSPRAQNFRYSPNTKQYTGDGNSPRNKSRDQHRQQPQNFLRSNPRQQPNPPEHFRHKPQIQSRSNSQPLVLQKPQSQIQFKSQQQPQPTQSQQSPQLHNRNHRQDSQSQQNHHQQQSQNQQEELQEPPPPPQQQEQQTNASKSSKSKKYYRSKKHNQKK